MFSLPISEETGNLDFKIFVFFLVTEVESVYCAVRIEYFTKKQIYFFFIGLKEKCIANTNLFVKQADSIAAKVPCIFLGVLLRDYFGACHAVMI